MAGYSGTPLPRKLGIEPGHRVLVGDAPAGFTVSPLPEDVEVHRRAGRGVYDVIVGFCPDRAALARHFAHWRTRLTPSGGLWIAWPKASGALTTDLHEAEVRAYGLSAGLVDNKICAVDQDWSALRFVVRLADRTGG
ncbi:hypothetical protein ABIA39_006794 [Nocardia sp. GAS34]|uniref:hypothetical protein n=1 Tax=unclassified Nocardia TaxID=2637762 RepID=UPI003D195F43